MVDVALVTRPAGRAAPPRARWPLAAVGAVNVALAAAVLFDQVLAVVALAVAIPVALSVLARPQRGILLLVAIVPFDGLLLLVDEPGLVPGWKEALTVLTLAATFVAPRHARAARMRPRRPGWLPAVIGWVAVGVAPAVAFGGLSGLYGFKITYFYLLALWALWRCPFDAGERDRLVSVLMVTGFVTAVYGIVQQAMGAEALAALGYPYNETIRFIGSNVRSFSTFVQPFPFAYFLMVVILVGLAVALDDPRRARNRVFLLCLPVFAAGITTPIVRGAWIGLAVGLAYLGFRRYKVLLLIFPLALVTALLLSGSAAESAFSSQSGVDRTTGWQANLDQVVESPLGVGIGTTGATADKVVELSGTDDEVYNPANQYFLTLYELGALGLWWMLLLFVGVFLAAHHASSTLVGESAALARGTGAMVLAAAAASLVSTYLQIFPMEVLWWVLIGAVATAVADEQLHPERVSTREARVVSLGRSRRNLR
ncbi:hypothetical protein BH24ACT3_BH24ACT3_09350 [soil metagenome]